ncbi:hypothetical protein PR001_g16415 [Phytophthora rubi]|uniref:EF-hand domain-containing protein n=1 Tax=Phytophthora rubi TaxID=129364 RepID=A0A6A3KVJ6_9STRA|nr:hypothetical protein PR001_g16415 [Phytophthora rubi]
MELWDVLITDVDDDGFIDGDDLLSALGIDVERQLEQLAARPEDESSGDPIALEDDDMPVPASEDNQPDGSRKDNIFAAFERLISRAVENGFPKERVEQLGTISHAYDIWRLKLRGDPPASVLPLERGYTFC